MLTLPYGNLNKSGAKPEGHADWETKATLEAGARKKPFEGSETVRCPRTRIA
ncbi:MAG TPA: hypothetical protein VGA19_07290 [Rhodospirillales bacterium]|jgi:hypothetical protein